MHAVIFPVDSMQFTYYWSHSDVSDILKTFQISQLNRNVGKQFWD